MKLANTLSIYQPTSKLAYFCWWKLANTFEAYDIDKFAPLISCEPGVGLIWAVASATPTKQSICFMFGCSNFF